MKRKGRNIISDQDVTMTSGKNIGKELSEVIGELQSKVSKHDSELKFFYNHGSIGASGSGGGTGGGGSNSFSVYATLNEKQISGDNISLGSDGVYPLTVKINRPNGANYSVKYSYTKLNEYDKEIVVSNTIQLGASNSWEVTIKDLEFKGNTVITVSATDSVYAETKQKSAPVLTRNYVFTPILKTRDTLGKEQALIGMTNIGKGFSSIASTQQFISSFNSGGLWLDLDYEISSAINTALDSDWEFTFSDGILEFKQSGKWPTDSETGQMKMNSIQTIDILQLLTENGWATGNKIDNNKAGQYTISLTITLQLKDSPTQKINYQAVVSMIPKDLYLLVNSEKGIIYNQKGKETPDLNEVYSYAPGQVNFIATPFRGTESDKNCTIYYYLVPQNPSEPTPQAQIATTTLGSGSVLLNKISTFSEGWHEVKFKLVCGEEGDKYPKPGTPGTDPEGYISYWFYTKPLDGDLVWTVDRDKKLGSSEFNYYRHSQEIRNLGGFVNKLSNLNSGGVLNQTTSSNRFVIGDPDDIMIPDASDPGKQARHNTIINIGLSYNEINPIPNYKGDEFIVKGLRRGELKFTVSQDNFVEGKANERPYFFPKSKLDQYQAGTDFHLLSIVSRVARDKKDGTYYYEMSLYIDGRLEGTIGNYVNSVMIIDTLEFGKVNAKINLVEIDYIPPVPDLSDPTGKDFLNEDNFIYRYYLKYRSLIQKLDVSEEDKRILGLLNNINVSNNGDVVFDTLETVANMAEYLQVPTLVLSVDDRSASGTEVMTYLKENLTEKAKAGNLSKLDVSVSWKMPGQSTLAPVEFPTGSASDTTVPNLSTAKFTLVPQGTSSMLYKCKNYTLALENTDKSDEAGVFLYSPNFNIGDPSTFLPEQEFTLKADVVDSGHSNNTSIGRFVNDVCRGFNTNERSGRPANLLERAGFIRNCLEGFPCVVYINIKTKDPASGAYTVNHIYYQGMYNFNLGRGSYYNLGYKDSKVFCDQTGTNCLLKPSSGNFVFYSVKKDEDQFKPGLVIAEIQDNRQYHDFSQYDESILFQQNSNDTSETPMFGDFIKVGWATESQQHKIIKNYVEKVAKGGGYLFESVLKKTLLPYKPETDDALDAPCGYEIGYSTTGKYNETGDLTVLSTQDGGSPANVVPNYKFQFNKTRDKVLHLKGVEQANAAAEEAERRWPNTEEATEIGKISDQTEREKRTAEAIARAKRGAWETELKKSGGLLPASGSIDFWKAVGKVDDNGVIPSWVDYVSTSEYYTICMAFGLVDSVEKNLNIKSWNATTSNPKTGDIDYGKFYAAFYDMDTCLGLDNAGNDDVSYFSFSDYWVTNYKEQGGKKIPQPAIIYRDYSPLTSTGARDKFYDVPSSYLFAIAKYAPLIVDASDSSASEVREFNPRMLWAKWRSPGVANPAPGDSVGCLRNSDWFMKKYFGANLGRLQAPLINMNYRNKYLYINSSGSYDVDAIGKFHGTRLHRVKDWLEGRLHILDAYFNLSSISSEINYYDKGKYVSFENLFETPITSVSGLGNNPDITILQDIFAGNQMLQIDGNLNISVRAKENSPLFITGAGGTNKYIIGGYNDSDLYNLNMVLLGSQTFSAGGSGSWTYLDSINTFRFGTLVIRSKYLEDISGTDSNYRTTISTLELPSLKNLVLSGRNYSGSVDLPGTSFPNLNSVDVSDNIISLSVSDSSLTSINLSGKTGGSVKIDNCKNIVDLRLGKTRLDSLEISQINPSLVMTDEGNNTQGGLELSGHRIKNIRISNTTTSLPGKASRISITNDPLVENISLTGFKQIFISNCPRLNVININDPESSNVGGDEADYVYISECGKDVHTNGKLGEGGIKEELRINTVTPGIADLTKLGGIRFLSIKECPYITSISTKPGRDIFVPASGFAGDAELEYLGSDGLGTFYLLDTDYYGNKTDLATFMNCSKFLMLTREDGEMTRLRVRSSVENLNYLFSIASNFEPGSLSLKNFCKFINNGIEVKSGIRSIKSMCYRQKDGFEYTESMLLSDLQRGTSDYIPSMVEFRNLSDVRNAFSCTGILAWHPRLFNFGQAVSSIKFGDYILPEKSGEVATTFNVLYDILGKIDFMFGQHQGAIQPNTEFKLYNTNGTLYYSKEISHSGGRVKVVPIRDFFSNRNNRAIHYKGPELLYTNFAKLPANYVYDFTEALDDMNGTLTRLVGFLRGDYVDYRETSITDKQVRIMGYDKLLLKVPSVYETWNSFYIYNPTYPLQLTKFLNWSAVCKKATNIFGWYGSTARVDIYLDGMKSFSCHKWITDTELNSGVLEDGVKTNPFWDYLVGTENQRNYQSSLTNLDNIFRNCTLILTSGSGGNTISPTNSALVANTKITSMTCTFSGFRIIRVPSDTGNYKFDSRHFLSTWPTEYADFGPGYGGNGKFFEQLPKVVYFDRCFEGTRQYYQPGPNFFCKRQTKPVDKGTFYLLKNRDNFSNDTKYWANEITYYVSVPYFDPISHTEKFRKEPRVTNNSKGNQFISVRVFRYDYNREIKGLYKCFYNVDWRSGDKVRKENGARFFNLIHQEGKSNRQILREVYQMEGDYIWIDETTDLTGTDWEGLITKIDHGYVLKWDEFDSVYAQNESYRPITNSTSEDPSKVRNNLFSIRTAPDPEYGNTSRQIFVPSSRLLEGDTNSELTEMAEDVIGGYQYKLTIGKNNPDVFNYKIDYNYEGGSEEFAKDFLIIAPDLFYGCAPSCNIKELFNTDKSSKLQGVLPKRLLKSVPSQPFHNMFRDHNVLPRFYKDIVSGNGNMQHCYVYVPENFTECTDLHESFNWHMMIPNASTVVGAYSSSVYDVYSIFTTKSFSVEAARNLTSLVNAFAVNGVFTTDETGIFSIYNGVSPDAPDVDNHVYFRLMVDNNFQDTGIDPVKFSKLRWDHIISGPLSYWLNGQWMVGSYNLDTVLKFNRTAPMIDIVESNRVLSNKIIMPTFNQPSALYNFIDSRSIDIYLKKSQMYNPNKLYTESNRVTNIKYLD